MKMSFEDNINLDTPPKQGRRGRGVSKDFTPDSDRLRSPDEPFLVKKTGGWAGEGVKSGKIRSADVDLSPSIEDHEDSDEDIPIIPDIDDLPTDSLPDVKIPSVAVKKTTYNEIDKTSCLENLKKDLALVNLADIDMLMLTSKLYAEAEVKSNDDIWTMESLAEDFAKIAQVEQ